MKLFTTVLFALSGLALATDHMGGGGVLFEVCTRRTDRKKMESSGVANFGFTI